MRLHLLIFSLSFSVAHAQYFSENYLEARKRFITSSEVLQISNSQIQVGSASIPSKLDSDLTLNYTYIPAAHHNTNLLVVTSGVHGPEAFVGSAIQLQLLDRLKIKSLKSTGVLLIHSVNPFGFKYLRRSSENNVDLNRNFVINTNIFSQPNAGYDKVKHLLENQESVSSFSKIWNQTLIGLLELLTSGTTIADLIQAVGQGQYHSPQGLYYGGQTHEPHVDIFKKLISHFSYAYEKAAFIDLHTGIGKKNQLTLMTGMLTTEESWSDLQKVFPKNKNAYYTLYNGNTNAPLSIYGDIVDLFSESLRPKVSFAFTAEYGTLGDDMLTRFASIYRMIVENQGFHYGFSKPTLKQKFDPQFLKLFSPSSPSWRKSTLSKSQKMFEQIFNTTEIN